MLAGACLLAWAEENPAGFRNSPREAADRDVRAPGAEAKRADFRYSPPWWQTAICLPDDPDKVLVGKEGQLLFDFGGGGERNFGLSVRPEVEGSSRWVRQQTLSARAPIVQTWNEAQGVEVLAEAFVVTPKAGAPELAAGRPALERMDGQERLRDWAKPGRACAPEFSGAEVAWNGSIRFRLKGPRNGRVTAVFGLCEGWHKEPGQRPLVLEAEGGESKTVNPVKDFGANQPGLYTLNARDANGDGFIDLSVGTPAESKDRNAILNALWVFDGPAPAAESILAGTADGAAYAAFPANSLPERQAVLLVRLRNTTSARATSRAVLRVQSVSPVSFSASNQIVAAGSGTRVSASERIESCVTNGGKEVLLRLAAVGLEPGASHQVAFVVERHSRGAAGAVSVEGALQLRESARQWWEQGELPFDTIQVPDADIQAMVESSVRNIWQAREIKQGQPAFHVGPTVYRGLWVVDGSFLLESAALLGRGQDARAGIEYLLSHQKPDGSFELLGRYWKENGIVLWAAARHAFLTQDKEWLRAHWPALGRVVKAIQNLRARVSQDPAALDYRLLPPGFIDGGIGGADKPEYSNVYWCLAGLKAAIAAARWLGDEAGGAAWQQEFDDFYAVFRKAAARDRLQDQFGNAYVPTMMGNLDRHVPARGQWAFCHAVYPGQVFAQDDPLVEGQLAMLGATKVEGMVFDTGWMSQGIWTYFASFYGHALLWQGHGQEAADVLYAFAQHASPTRVWREEQKPVGKGNEEVGDMPHNWASAEFIRLTTHLLEVDRGNELHLLEGFPPEWAGPGRVTRLNGVLTPFGPLRLEVRVAGDGRSARVKMGELKGSRPAKVVLHLTGLAGRNETVELPVDGEVEREVER